MCTEHNMPTHPTSAETGVGRFNAWFFDYFDNYNNHIANHHKRNAFAGLKAGIIVELGAGTGANFRYLPENSQLIAIEPGVDMHDRLRRNAAEQNIDLQLIGAPAEKIPLPDESVDEVIATLVLCTVSDPAEVLSEIKRILRPGGKFRFVEHVGAHPASPRRWVQNLIARPWAWIFQGCRTNRDTASVLALAGFSELRVEKRKFRHSAFFPVNSAIWGIASKAG